MKKYGLLLLILMLIIGCKSTQHSRDTSTDKRNIVKEIRRVKENTYRIYASADYITYSFESSENIRENQLNAQLLENKPGEFDRTSSLGTATLILQNSNHQVFLTCYHIFNYPDTIKQYYYRKDGSETPFLSSVSIKNSQKNFTKINGKNTPLQFIAADPSSDIALLTTTKTPLNNPVPYHLEIIDGKDVEDGSSAIVCGYPAGFQMASRATISKQSQTDKVLLDASFNRGYSGAPYFVTDKSGKLKLAGMVTAAASSTKNIIVPEFDNHKKHYDPNKTYQRNLYVNADERIKYGITFTLTSEEIKDFYIENIHLFNNKNISLQRVFNIKDL